MNIYNVTIPTEKSQDTFKPTYICIKRHSITGLLYLCKTTKSYKDMLKYTGSGDRWLSHIKKHKKEFVVTDWYCLFYSKEEIKTFALMCSEQWGIVKSNAWANEKPEDGLRGGSAKGRKCPNRKKSGPRTPESIAKQITAQTGKIRTEKQKQHLRKPKQAGFGEIISKAKQGIPLSTDHKNQLKLARSRYLLSDNSTAQRITINNVKYNSISEASRVLNISFYMAKKLSA